MTALLDVSGMRANYGEIEALHGINFAVERGSIVALLGANGAGKTTSLRAISGIVRRSGTITFDGTSLQSRAAEDIARMGIAHVPEGRGTLSELSVWENLSLGGYLADSRSVSERYERVVSYFPWIEQRKKQPAGTLSGGEQQMLAIGRALMMAPKMMLLDEPSLGLAPLIVHEIFELLRKINREQGMTILVAEQNATMALAVASHVYVLETGRVALSGSGEELMRDERVRKSYLGY